LHAMISDKRVQAVMCARGGYGALRLLSGLDYDMVRSFAKPLIGFSDITALQQAFQTSARITTFHGPVVTTLEKADEESLTSFVEALCGSSACNINADQPIEVLPGKACGRVAGGNLTVLAHMTGTPYTAQLRDCIVVFEDVGEAPYRIDRMLTQMELAGVFDGLCGVVLGSFKECGDQDELISLFKDFFVKKSIPVAAGFAIGHTDRNLTIPLGVSACLDASKGELRYVECATC